MRLSSSRALANRYLWLWRCLTDQVLATIPADLGLNLDGLVTEGTLSEIGRGRDRLHQVAVREGDAHGIADEAGPGVRLVEDHVVAGVARRVHDIDGAAGSERDPVSFLEHEQPILGEAVADQLQAYRERTGWGFRWVSSLGNSFNFDYNVSFTPEQIEGDGGMYNFREGAGRGEELPGFSVFYKGDDGAIYHTYSCYARGLDMLNGTYHLLDLLPKGRDEQDLPAPMAWVKLHDSY